MSEKERRLRWQCRRGMLELDALLQPFFEKHFSELSPALKEEFERLLTCSDQDLFSWFIGSAQPSDPGLQSIVEQIKSSLPFE